MKTIRLAALLAVTMGLGCDGDPGPHDEVNCSAQWGSPMNLIACENACEPMPIASEEKCMVDGDDGEFLCDVYIVTFDGVRGCCAPAYEVGPGTHFSIRWFECLD